MRGELKKGYNCCLKAGKLLLFFSFSLSLTAHSLLHSSLCVVLERRLPDEIEKNYYVSQLPYVMCVRVYFPHFAKLLIMKI